MKSKSAILFVASPGWTPGPTGGGSTIISHSLIETYQSLGCRVGFCGLIKPAKFASHDASEAETRANGIASSVSVYFGPRTLGPEDTRFVREAVNSFQPDIIYCYGPEPAALAAESGHSAVRVATFYDPQYAAAVHRLRSDLKYGDMRERIGALRKWKNIFQRWRSHRLMDLPGLDTADIIVGHAYNHSREYEKYLKRPILYFPNPTKTVAALPKLAKQEPPTFIMAGTITSTVSRTGLQFFAHEVLPHIRDDLNAGRMQVRIIGGGTLTETYFALLKKTPGITFVGYVKEHELLEEYARSIALLVPTPIPVGFRTRIIDAFRHGVPVISHTANQTGFRELDSGNNCFMASDGREFADHMLRVAATPASAAKIAATALHQFEEQFSATRYVDMLFDAIEKVSLRRQGSAERAAA